MADKTEMTIAAYNTNSTRYANKFMQFDSYISQVMEFGTLLKDGFAVLDIGCGPGNVAQQLCSRKELSITGIDLSEEMLALAKRNVPHGTFLLQDIRYATFLPESFDVVILSFCIVHLEAEEAKAVLEHAIKWVKSGGYVYLSFMEGKKPGLEMTSFSEQPLYFNYFQENEVKDFIELRGLECIRSARQDYAESDGSTTVDVFLFLEKR